ncbi:MAG: hypothetical protein F4Y01_11435 [Gammaproteobacteria bacterium]|nr:hypothetical protein [Gammaproteobacteria bacterium]
MGRSNGKCCRSGALVVGNSRSNSSSSHGAPPPAAPPSAPRTEPPTSPRPRCAGERPPAAASATSEKCSAGWWRTAPAFGSDRG